MSRPLSNEDFQSTLLNKVQSQLPEGGKLLDYLMDTLKISKSNAYRRISGETQLTQNEVNKLAKRFHISLDDCLQLNKQDSQDIVVFKRNPFIQDIDHVSDYFTNTLKTLEQLKAAEDVELFYAARDLPIFYFLLYPTLCRFKVFVWLRGPESENVLDQENFAYNQVSDEMVRLGEKLGSVYQEISSTEIWTERTVQNILRQVKYYFDAGGITLEVAKTICDELIDLLNKLHKEVTNGFKGTSPFVGFNLYHTEFLLLENSVIAKVHDQKIAYVSYASINFMHTDQASFCEHVMKWFQEQTKKSVLLSTASSSIRNRFFSRVLQKITFFKEQIERERDVI